QPAAVTAAPTSAASTEQMAEPGAGKRQSKQAGRPSASSTVTLGKRARVAVPSPCHTGIAQLRAFRFRKLITSPRRHQRDIGGKASQKNSFVAAALARAQNRNS
ncbi:MAG TPA: hypothetical protein PKC77_14330, partial [Sphingopyxis sp.]|nr:hypothetical protein [Sphingopyxis sp.]